LQSVQASTVTELATLSVAGLAGRGDQTSSASLTVGLWTVEPEMALSQVRRI
jgi:hypothetical protein